MEVVYNFVTGKGLIISIIVFIILSYLIMALITWSIKKPLKYLGISIIITGIITLIMKYVFSLVIKYGLEEKLGFFKPFFASCEELFVKYGVSILAIGIGMIIVYKILDLILKPGKKDKKIEGEKE